MFTFKNEYSLTTTYRDIQVQSRNIVGLYMLYVADRRLYILKYTCDKLLMRYMHMMCSDISVCGIMRLMKPYKKLSKVAI